jgi:two-component system sensor histidine kinase PilS (NtrC family)
MTTAAPQDRRSGDRRRTDRRTGGRQIEESWFGAESAFAPGWATPGGDGDSRFADAEPARPARTAGSEDNALARIYRTYAAARAAFGVALVAAQGVSNLLGTRVSLLLTLCCIAYAVQAVTLWLLPRFRPLTAPLLQPGLRRRQWLATVGVDLAAFGTLHLAEPGANFNYAALLVLPVLMAGVMTQRLVALGTAAGVALMLLFVAWRGGAGGGDLPTLMLQSGLAGLGLFVIAVLAGELAARLAREEQAARGSLELARQQAQLNRLVIEEMVDGVLVVDRRLRVRAANPAARALLVDAGLSPPAPFGLQARPAWVALAQAVERALAEQDWPEAGREVALVFDGGHLRKLRMRVRFMRSRALAREGDSGSKIERFCVLLLEDVRTAQARIRQEKLAAMGRVSAGIAHEIRNPLAAIVQANALLLEDDLPPQQQRLARMVADNAERLKRIVDDVMELVPGGASSPRAIDVSAEVAAAAAEWARTVGLPLGASSRLRVDLATQPLGVSFDPEHLRRVLVNLLDNAHRHAGDGAGAILLRLTARDDGPVELSVASDGPPIAPDVEPYLFEPFFSTRSRGTGLGLYICRELCERYGASIEYRALAAPVTNGTPPFRLLVVDDEPDLRTLYELTLLREGYDVESAETVAEAWAALQAKRFNLVITDMRLPDGSGLDLLRRLDDAGRGEKGIVITAYGSAENAVEALKAGAYDYLTKPVDLRQFRAVVASALGRTAPAPAEAPRARAPDPRPAGPRRALDRLVGESGAMLQVRALVGKVARSMAPALVQGESGTGKELVARAIHDGSPRGTMPFVAVNCGAIPENLLEAEFFGYRKGAFTGANEDREGFFQAAQGGTLFLDEIGDLPLAMQSKLLRVIQERAVRPIGAVAEQAVNVRIVSATHKDLGTEVHAGRFRQDLF